jgi:hypothetical protein
MTGRNLLEFPVVTEGEFEFLIGHVRLKEADTPGCIFSANEGGQRSHNDFEGVFHVVMSSCLRHI